MSFLLSFIYLFLEIFYYFHYYLLLRVFRGLKFLAYHTLTLALSYIYIYIYIYLTKKRKLCCSCSRVFLFKLYVYLIYVYIYIYIYIIKHKNLSNSMVFADFITTILQPVLCLHYCNLQANEQFVSYTAFYSVFLTFKTSYGVIF